MNKQNPTVQAMQTQLTPGLILCIQPPEEIHHREQYTNGHDKMVIKSLSANYSRTHL